MKILKEKYWNFKEFLAEQGFLQISVVSIGFFQSEEVSAKDERLPAFISKNSS